jgi:hypothetical protein
MDHRNQHHLGKIYVKNKWQMCRKLQNHIVRAFRQGQISQLYAVLLDSLIDVLKYLIGGILAIIAVGFKIIQ